jgi:hypothetical protein
VVGAVVRIVLIPDMRVVIHGVRMHDAVCVNREQSRATASIPRTCAGIKRDGTRCTLPVAGGGPFCFAHSPGRAESRRRGGRGRSAVARLLKHASPELRELVSFVHEALVAVRAGELEARRGTAIAALARVLIELHEQHELRARLEALEQLAGAGVRR